MAKGTPLLEFDFEPDSAGKVLYRLPISSLRQCDRGQQKKRQQ